MEDKRIYTIDNKYMFSAVMRHGEICRRVLERILDKHIDEISFPEYEKTLDPEMFTKGIRIDIYCKDENTNYTIEMQNATEDALPKRGRYYQSLMDSADLEKGSTYDGLKQGIVIFICKFDPYGEGRHIYSFENRCIQDTALCYGDETRKIILSTKGIMDDVSAPLKNFLDYIDSYVVGDDPLVKDIDDMVTELNSDKEWRMNNMTVEQEIKIAAKREAEKVAQKYEGVISEKDALIAEKDASIAEKDAEIRELREELSKLR